MKQTINKIENELIKIAEENFGSDLIVDADQHENNEIIMGFKVKGGWDKQCNCGWGCEEYLDDYIEMAKEVLEIKNITYDLDHEDLTGDLIISY